MADAEPTTTPTDYIRVKRKKVTIFLYMEPGDTVHDLRARVNHITKVPTTDVKFFIDINGEVPVDENKSLSDQKVAASLMEHKAVAVLRNCLPSICAQSVIRCVHPPLARCLTSPLFTAAWPLACSLVALVDQ